MWETVLLATTFNRLWYALPLIVAISFVYAATRHEQALPILHHALHFGAWVIGFMLVLFCILLALTYWL